MAYEKVYESIVDTCFNTPLVRLRRVVPEDHAAVLAKCEFFNPMASVKDRIAEAMIGTAERDGAINPDT
ncbi:MAG: pyridoxal-phosphate dependent enzyme, partial [Planctomycetota bacterium]